MSDPSQAPLVDWQALLKYLTGGDPHSQTPLVNPSALQPQPRAVNPSLGLPAAPPPNTPLNAPTTQIPINPPAPPAPLPDTGMNPLNVMAVLGPLAPVIVAGVKDPHTASSILASTGMHPSQLGFHTGTEATDFPGVSGTTIAPVTRPSSGDRTTGAPDATPVSSSGVSGADGGSNLPAPTLRPQSAVAAGAPVGSTADTGTYVPGPEDYKQGARSADAASLYAPATKKPFDYDALSKALGSLKAPAEHDPHYPTAPRVETSQHRFNPTDLLALVQGLSAPAAKAVPQSLGQLMGR